MKNTNRRGFLKGVATLSAMGAVKCGSAMMPDEQAAYDKYNAMVVPRPDGLLDGEPRGDRPRKTLAKRPFPAFRPARSSSLPNPVP